MSNIEKVPNVNKADIFSGILDRLVPPSWKRKGMTPDQIEQKLIYDTAGEFDSTFDVFLRYSTQKTELAKELARQINILPVKENRTILDIGTGEGTLFAKLTQTMQNHKNSKTTFVLLEPNIAYTSRLKGMGKILEETSRTKNIKVYPIRNTWENFSIDQMPEKKKADIIICSHTIYHFNPNQLDQLFRKMIDFLNPGGNLFLVAREPDSIYNFIMNFYEDIHQRPCNDITIAEAIPKFTKMIEENKSLKTKNFAVSAEINFPWRSNINDAIVLTEFFLREKWVNIKDDTKLDIYHYFQNSDTLLRTRDQIIRVTKLQ